MTALQTKITRMTLLAVCSAALTAPLAVFAQDAPPPPPPPAQNGGGGDMMARMQAREAAQLQALTTQLSLTDAQQASVKQIFADRDAKMSALFSNQSLSQDDRRSQMMAMRTDSNSKIRALLTPDQQTKFDAMPPQMGPRGGGGGMGGGGGTPPPQQ
jgi:Spy/CpxP family protein refolding chaperone